MKPYWHAALMVGILLAAGCGTPVVGAWRSDKKLGNGARNTLDVYDDLTGDAIIYATPKTDLNAWTKFRFDLDWEDEGESFFFSMDCKSGPCSGDDFSMDCEVINEGTGDVDKLDCQGNKHWKSYPFDWERDEE